MNELLNVLNWAKEKKFQIENHGPRTLGTQTKAAVWSEVIRHLEDRIREG